MTYERISKFWRDIQPQVVAKVLEEGEGRRKINMFLDKVQLRLFKALHSVPFLRWGGGGRRRKNYRTST